MRPVRYSILGILVVLGALILPRGIYGADKSVPVRSDLDGDQQSDTATGRISGSTLKIKIHLSSNRVPVLLSTVVGYEPGLALAAYDVDNDNKTDLVLTSIFSVRPVAVWLNTSNGRFTKASGWIAAFPVHDGGPQFHRRSVALSEHDALSWADPLPVLDDTASAGSTLQEYGRAAPHGGAIVLTRCYTNCPERAPPLS